jgi:hypothetical protein
LTEVGFPAVAFVKLSQGPRCCCTSVGIPATEPPGVFRADDNPAGLDSGNGDSERRVRNVVAGLLHYGRSHVAL